MKVLILGLGNHGGGFAATTYFLSRGDEVRISDRAARENFGIIPDYLESLGAKCTFGPQTKKDIKWADIVIKNPAIPATNPLLAHAKRIETDISMLFKYPGIEKIKLICVTGTKGKTTTVSALTNALKLQGKEVFLCGNIGISAFFAIKEIEKRKAENLSPLEYIVIELSSWQIHDAYISLQGHWPKMELIVLTNIFLDHQNSYSSLDTYVADKLELFTAPAHTRIVPKAQKGLFETNLNVEKLPIKLYPRFSNPFKNTKTALMPAFEALRWLKVDKATAEKLLLQYKGTQHRTEQVAVKDNIMYINDSAATIAEAVNFSISNIKPLQYHLICGGTDKNLPADKMSKVLKDAQSITLLNGSFTQNKLIPLLDKLKLEYSGPFNSMKEAFEVANYFAQETEQEKKKTQVVILSPGAASFELFTNEFARGDAFKKEVTTFCGKKSI